MKKQLLAFSLLLVGLEMSAQNAVLNGGFENWDNINYQNPKYYGSSNNNELGNSIMSPNTTQAKSPDSYTGAYSVKLETVFNGSDTVAAYFYNGDPGSGNGGIPIGGTPTALVGYYKGTIMPGDTALVIVMCKYQGSVISFDLAKLAASQTGFTQFSLPINLPPMITPDSVIIAAASSNALDEKGIPGSTVYFDSFEFTGLAQQPAMLNGDFEQWESFTKADLLDWYIGGADGFNPQDGDSHTGMYAVKLETQYDSDNAQAYGTGLNNGMWNNSNNNYDGKPFTNQIDTLCGWYKYNLNGVDSGRISLYLTKNGVGVAYKEFFFTPANNYTFFSIPYNASAVPDTVKIYVSSSSSNTDVSNVGTVLKIDDLYFKSQIPTVTETSNDVSCNGADDGAIDITVTGGFAPYQFAWSNGAPFEDINGLAPGTYTVTVTDSVGTQAVYNVTISEPTALSVVMNPNDANCSQNDGDATATPSGGTMPYTYSWAGGPTTASYTGLAAGIYTVLVTDANGCTVSEYTTIGNINGPSASANINNGISCNGDLTGEIVANATGGTPTYTYSWSQGGNTTNTASGLGGGSYTVQVTDAAGCIAFASATLTEPAVLDVQPGLQFDPSCYGWTDGQLSGMVTGGTQIANPPYYHFMFSNGVTADVAVNLGAGTHTITVTDSLGCVDSVTAILNQPNPLVLSIDSVFDVMGCFGDNTGAAYLSVTGGNGMPYDYVWNNIAGMEYDTALTSGNYEVYVKDPFNCMDTVQLVINEPAQLVLSIDSTFDATCYGNNDGSAYVSSTGGTGSYTYSWSNGNIIDADQTLAANTYSVTVTDANGCTHDDSFVISEPTELVATAGSVNDSAYVNVTGGTAPYIYSWYQGGNTTNYATGLSNGTYTVSVMDMNGCVDSDSTTVVVTGINGLASNNISVYPNPSNGVFFINSNITNNTAPVNVTIRNVIGEVVFSRTESQMPSLYKVNVGATLPAGMYTIELQNGEKQYMTKIFFE